MRLKLKFLSGQHKGRTLPIEEGKKITIGRLSSNTVSINSDFISRNHACIEFNGIIKIVDSGGINPTRLNGTKLVKGVAVNVNLHDVIQVGDTLITVIEDHGTSAPQGLLGMEIDSHFKGQLGQISVIDTLQFLNKNKSTGTLYVDASDGANGQVLFNAGDIVFIRWKSKNIDYLKALGRIVEIKFGDFAFIPGEIYMDEGSKIKMSFDELLMSAVKQIDDLNYTRGTRAVSDIKLKLPFTMSVEELTPIEQKVYHLIYQQVLSKEVGIADVLDESFLSNADTYRVIINLISKGFLDTSY